MALNEEWFGRIDKKTIYEEKKKRQINNNN